jgi:hypothetical protein
MRPPLFPLRGVQIDLARQRETLPAIADFARFAADWGYNALVLYLEGVARTRSFPYRPAHRSYSPADIEHIVRAATRAGLAVIPCVSTLGHVEHFTACRPLRSLAEDRRRAPHMFCPSNPRVYEFLGRYLAEIAALFPGKDFHIGCDEAWGLGSCRRCRPRAATDLLIGHIRRVRAILQPLGKRVWIWDDMLENETEQTFARLPRDVVMCTWQYSPELIDRTGIRGHFNNLRRRDWLAIYQRLGFDVVICPWARETENIRAFTEYARGRRVFGGLCANWEGQHTFLPAVLPGVALAGALWSQSGRDPIRELFPRHTTAARAALVSPLWPPAAPAQAYLRGGLTWEESRHLHAQHLIARQLADAPGDMLAELAFRVRLQLQAGRLRERLPRFVDPRAAPVSLADCAREYDRLARQRDRDWRRYRPGILPNHASALLRQRARELRALRRPAALLELRLFLAESFSAPILTVALRGAGRWVTVARGCLKPVNERDAQYTIQVPVDWRGRAPDRLRLTVTGYGGQGIAFAALHFATRTLQPSAVVRQRGRVLDARALLRDDARVCYLGDPDTVRTLRRRESHRAATVTLDLARLCPGLDAKTAIAANVFGVGSLRVRDGTVTLDGPRKSLRVVVLSR